MTDKARDAQRSKINGTISFVQNHVPPLNSGTYQAKLRQEVSVEGWPDELLERTYEFAVAGDRFRLLPGEVSTVFPPADSKGQYDNVLPHVVLTRKTLPWERTAEGGPTKRDAVGDVTPWMGLLVFDSTVPVPVQTVTVADLLNDTLVDGAGPREVFSGFSHKVEDLGFHEKLTDPCQVIDVPLELFSHIAPSKRDLHWLAQARVLDVPPPRGQPGGNPGPTDYAVVIGNRLPAVNDRNTACLVSLEAVEDFLPHPDGNPSDHTSEKQHEGKTHIRLIVLKSWSFFVQPAHEENNQSFAQLIAGLNDSNAREALLLNPSDTGIQIVDNMLGQGYTALPHQTRLGDSTVSWFRGPLTPHKPTGASAPPVLTADSLAFYDEETAMFDVSYSAAWRIGQLLALNSKGFATQLYSWKRALRLKTSDLLVQKHLRAMAPHLETAEDEASKRRLVQDIIVASLRHALAHDPDDKAARDQAARDSETISRDERQVIRQATVTDAAELARLHGDRPDVPPSIASWLGRLMLLHGVPFNYLVPDAKMLPVESIRFFRLDTNWIDALVDGASSIGRNSELDKHDLAFATHLRDQAWNQIGVTNKRKLSGFLLRSALVEGWWPGLKIDGYNVAKDHPEDSARLPMLRFERLSPSILLCLFDGVVCRVDLHPPPEGLHYGLSVLDRNTDAIPVAFEKDLRNLNTGEQLMKDEKAVAVPIHHFDHFRQVTHRVVHIDALAKEMLAHFPCEPFTSAEFGMQMIEGTQMGGFIHHKGALPR